MENTHNNNQQLHVATPQVSADQVLPGYMSSQPPKQKSKTSSKKIISGVIGLVTLLVIAGAGILIAQRQQLIPGLVAPNAPSSQPSASMDDLCTDCCQTVVVRPLSCDEECTSDIQCDQGYTCTQVGAQRLCKNTTDCAVDGPVQCEEVCNAEEGLPSGWAACNFCDGANARDPECLSNEVKCREKAVSFTGLTESEYPADLNDTSDEARTKWFNWGRTHQKLSCGTACGLGNVCCLPPDTPPQATSTPIPSNTPPPGGTASCSDKQIWTDYSSNNGEVVSDSAQFRQGDTFVYRIAITADANTDGEVVVTDQLDVNNLEFVNSAEPNKISYNDGTVTMVFDQVAGQETVFGEFKVKVKDTAQVGSVTNNQVQIAQDGETPISAGSSCSATFSIPASGTASCVGKTAKTVPASGAGVTIEAESFVKAGDEIEYMIEIQATSLTSGAVTITDTLPANLEYVRSTSSESEFTVTNQGQVVTAISQQFEGSRVFSFVAKVKDDAQPGTVSNNVTVSTQNSDSDPASCGIEHIIPPNGVANCTSKDVYLSSDLATALNSSSVVNTGEELTYRVNITATSQTAGQVIVSDTLPGNLEFVSSDDFTNANGTLTATLEAFTGAKTLEFKAKVKSSAAAGSLKNTVTVTTNDSNGTALTNGSDSCSAEVTIPSYTCGSSCTSDSQCQNANSDFVCSSSQGNTCRLSSNQSSTSCQPAPKTYACNSSCTSDADCQTANSNYVCSSDHGNVCRLNSNTSATNCQPAAAATPTPVVIGCNETCVTNADCSNSSHICFNTGSGLKCRLDTNPTSSSCSAGGVVIATPAPQPTLPPELPQSGPDDWATWLKAGLLTVGLGAVLLLLL